MKLKTINKWINIIKEMVPNNFIYYLCIISLGLTFLAKDFHLEAFYIFCSGIFVYTLLYILTWFCFTIFFLLMRKRYFKKRSKLLRERINVNESK